MISTRTSTRGRSLLLALLSLLPGTAHASGPRWVTGQPYYSPEGVAITWYTSSPRYFTDPGDLSPYVSHSAADAIVNAAAAVWTVPSANLNLLYGGTLAQHASSDNVYAASTGIVFPSDTLSANYLNIQIAVLYDSDGSIIDLMLGNGASSPSSCRQNAVLESVDAISTAGKIRHAILVLNGRCTGPAPEQQLQLQYQLMRAFGRVLGLSWSQTNDNVFTGTPTPTIQQAMHWPIMHPIDVICGPYTYQCTPQPFTLRDDDVAGLSLLYPVGVGAAPSVPRKDQHPHPRQSHRRKHHLSQRTGHAGRQRRHPPARALLADPRRMGGHLRRHRRSLSPPQLHPPQQGHFVPLRQHGLPQRQPRRSLRPLPHSFCLRLGALAEPHPLHPAHQPSLHRPLRRRTL